MGTEKEKEREEKLSDHNKAAQTGRQATRHDMLLSRRRLQSFGRCDCDAVEWARALEEIHA